MKRLLQCLTAVGLLCSWSAFALPVNLNTADANTISAEVKGIGPAKADAIVKYRTENGEFKSMDDLLNVPGIGPKVVDQIKEQVIFTEVVPDAPAPQAAPNATPAQS